MYIYIKFIHPGFRKGNEGLHPRVRRGKARLITGKVRLVTVAVAPAMGTLGRRSISMTGPTVMYLYIYINIHPPPIQKGKRRAPPPSQKGKGEAHNWQSEARNRSGRAGDGDVRAAQHFHDGRGSARLHQRLAAPRGQQSEQG